jgi:hypothetical protein
MPARPVAVRHGERSAQDVCLFLAAVMPRVHFIGPWLVVDVRFDVWLETRGDARNRAGSEGSWCFGKCFAAGVRLIGASWFVSGWEALRGQIRPTARYRCEGEGVAQCLRCPAFIRQSLGMRIDAVHQFLKNLAH